MIDDKTKAIFFESLSNPQIAIPAIEKIVEVAKNMEFLTICDNTVASAALFNPIEWGVDVSVHSTSKYTNGQMVSSWWNYCRKRWISRIFQKK